MRYEHGEPTDDLGLSPEFLCDEDIARDDDNYGRERRCTCGYLAALADADTFDHHDRPDRDGFAGCRGCDPVDWECQPYGFGIQRWEDRPLMAAQHACRTLNACRPGLLSDATYAAILEAARTIYSARRERHARRVWERLCDDCETHRQAVKRYAEWAARATSMRYRDSK